LSNFIITFKAKLINHFTLNYLAMKNRLLSIFALLALLTIGACSDDEPKAKSITDADGIVITLTWITDGTAAQALEDYDLDISAVNVAELEIEGSGNFDAFEEFSLEGTNSDGDWVLSVDVYENNNGKPVDYIVTISGGGKEYEFEGDFAANSEAGDADEVLTITKAGDKYTIKD
jgi:hypothetical protein